MSGCTISRNSAVLGGGIYAVNLNMMNSAVSGNTAAQNGGGIYCAGTAIIGGTSQITGNMAAAGYGGGIYFSDGPGESLTFDGTKASVKNNKAHMPFSAGSWYQGYGVYLTSGTPISKNGFDYTKQVKGNAQAK